MHNATCDLLGVGCNECVQTLFVDKATGHTYTKMTRQGLELYPLSTQNYMNMVANEIHLLLACLHGGTLAVFICFCSNIHVHREL